MNGFPVNIADFRCRVFRSRTAHTSLRAAHRPSGFSLVQAHPRQGASVSISDAVISSNPRVYDIGIAREVQHSHERSVFRPISIVRRANVVRFSKAAESVVTPMRNQVRAIKHSADYDLPPAA